jgi:hypothetical protein
MKKIPLISLSLLLALATTGLAEVAQLAPDFALQNAGKHATLKSLRGQPVVLIVARSAADGTFRKQAKLLKELYQQFASRGTVFIAAFLEERGTIPSDVPFVVANNAAKIAADYRTEGKFGLYVIGTDGNTDLQTSRITPAGRIYDVIQNSYTAQAEKRKLKLPQ